MIKINIVRQLLVGTIGSMIGVSAVAQVTTKGLPPPANAYRSFLDASLVRDSGLGQPLDLLNDFYPSIVVSIEDHDNVRRRSDVEEDDVVMTVSPALAYRSSIGRHQFYASYNGTYTFHDELDQEDSVSNALSAQLGLDINRRWDLNIFGGVGEAVEQRGISGGRPFNQFIIGEDTGPDELEYTNIGADLIYGRKVSPLIAILGIEQQSAGFKNNGQGDDNPFGNRDRTQTSVHFDLSYKLGAKTRLFGRVQKSDVDYDRSINSLDSEQTDYLFGVRWKPTNALSGVIGVGTSEKEFDNRSLESYDGDTYYVNLNYTLNPFSIIELSASRSVEEPGDDVSNFYESDLFGIGWNHSLRTDLVFGAYAKWVDDNYDIGRDDEFFDFGLSLDYVWKAWLTAGIYYGEIERESSFDTLPYEDRYFGIRIRSDLRPLLEGRGSKVEPESFDYPKRTQSNN